MWCTKMAARWKGKDEGLNGGGSDFLAIDAPNKSLHLCRGDGVDMDSTSCADHSILSLFEDPAVTSECKNGVEEESETLLSALSEMLDSVEDDDGTLSPFDVLPDTKLLSRSGGRANSMAISLTGRCTPRTKSPNDTFTVKRDVEKDYEAKIQNGSLPQLFTQQSPAFFNSRSTKAENEVEVFNSTSLVNLVKLMHPYCLKLHVEEGSKRRKNVFSQEEVWRYERPSEESDEEINVVSDNEEPVSDTMGKKKGEEKRDDGKLQKSALLNGTSPRPPSSREKKRVSFGPVQVASFNESAEKNHTSESVSVPLNSTKALGNQAGSALEPQTTMSSQKAQDKAAVLPPKGETKAKSLSLQQYRQLRHKRQPLVEKQGNNTTKWPSVSEPPTELPPILCLETQGQHSCGPKTIYHYPHRTSICADRLHKSGHKIVSHGAPPSSGPSPSEPKPSTHLQCGGLKRHRPESKSSSPASPLADATANPNVKLPERIKSQVKKTTMLSSDPPNPVLVPQPVCQATSPSTALSSSKSLSTHSNSQKSTPIQKLQDDSSAASIQRQTSSSEPKPQVSLVKRGGTSALQEVKVPGSEIVLDVSSSSSALCPLTTQTESTSEKTEPEPKTSQSPGAVQPLSPVDAPIPIKNEFLPEISSPEEPPPTPSNSGIEAPDLTSLLEQFEETQAKNGQMELDRNQLVGSEKTLLTDPLKQLGISESLRNPKALRNLPQLQSTERVDIPEPLGTEIVLIAQQEQPARHKNPPSKAIQIIDPRPLPSRKTHSSTSEPPAAHTSPHMYLSVSIDHDYCGSLDYSLTGATRRSKAKPSSLKDISNELQVNSPDIHQRKAQSSTGETKSVSQLPSKQPTTRPDTNPSTDQAPQVLDTGGSGGVSEDKTAPYTLPTPPPSPPNRGREKRRYRRRYRDSDSSSCCSSSSSSSSSSSASCSPKRRRLHRRRSESSSCSSSPCRSISHSPPRRYRLSYSRSRCSRSRSRSWSQSRSPSRSRSPSLQICRRRWKDDNRSSSGESRRLRREHELRIQKLKAIDERRVVYVGRIRRSMTHNELRERFSQFGDVECVSLHFRDRGDHYAFVTFYNMADAFAAIDNGFKLRKPDELPFDLCFGGRRQFCNSNYADLDANRDAELSPAQSSYEDQDFDSLLKQAQRGLNT